MSPKEKAIELVTNMSFSKSKVADYVTGEMVDVPGNIYAKQCALVHVGEMIKKLVELSDDKFTFLHDVMYYQEVQQEIQKL
jgi:hypothetical protein